MTNNSVFVSEISFSFQRYSGFSSKTDAFTDRLSVKINHKIVNVSGNIGVMLLKLGSSNVPQVRHKMTFTVLLSW